MIKKLRRRFMTVIMIMMAALLAGVLICIYFFMYKSEEDNAQKVLEFAINADFLIDNPPDRHNSHELDGEAPVRGEPELEPDSGDIRFERFAAAGQPSFRIDLMSGWMLVQISAQNETQFFYSQLNRNENGEYISDTDDFKASAAAAAQKVIESGGERGFIYFEDTSYRYLCRAYGDGYRIVFKDRTNEIMTLNRLMVILLGIFAATSAVMLALSYLLSRWAARPVEDAWNRQKVFFSNASHELKTPLTVISANIDVILSNPQESVQSQEKWFGYIKSESAKMSRLINEMLFIAKEDAQAERKEDMSEYNLSEIIEGACLTFEALAFERNRTLEQDIAPDIVSIGERESIQRVVHILIDNAISHSSDNSAVVVKLWQSKRGRVKLSVSNRGEDIPPESLERLFDRYYRTDASRSKDTGGFGLGLAIAKTIIDKHGGTITAESKNGITSFTVTLPGKPAG